MEGLSQNEKIIWNCWQEKSHKDVVREAAAKGTHINLCLKYLMKKNSWTETEARHWFLNEVNFIFIYICKFYSTYTIIMMFLQNLYQ